MYVYIYIYIYDPVYMTLYIQAVSFLSVFLLLYRKIAILCLHKKQVVLYIDKAFSYNYKGNRK